MMEFPCSNAGKHKPLLIVLNAETQTRAKLAHECALQAERSSEEAPTDCDRSAEGDAMIRAASNTKDAEVAEMTTRPRANASEAHATVRQD